MSHINRSTLPLAFLALIVACSSPAESPTPPKEASVRPGANETFLADDLDVGRYAGIFDMDKSCASC